MLLIFLLDLTIFTHIFIFFFTGWFYDGTGSYNISFHVAGTVVAFSGAILYIIPFIERCTNRKPYSRNTELIMEDPNKEKDQKKELEMS